nr:VRR-NUC domain-containing protein [Marinifaba aquimaris]
MATRYHGEKNALFRWSEVLLARLLKFLQHADPNAVKQHLLNMAKNFKALKDGYPDLMVENKGQLTFFELKAPGDSIRRNQLVTIKALQSVGFNVEIATVTWSFNPNQKYAVVDIETTGGKSGNHRITEIGIATVQNGQIIDKWSTLINPMRSIPAHITQLTGIDNEMTHNAPVFADIAAKLKEQLQGKIFVAHNVDFDFGFIRTEYERLGAYFSMPKLCTVRLMRKHFPKLSSYGLGPLSQTFDLPLENHHRALDDAIAAAHLLILAQQKQGYIS